MADNRQVPSVPNVSDPVLRNFLSAVREAVNTAAASTSITASSLLSSLTTAVSGGGSPILSGFLDSSTPPAPAGLAVQGMRVNNFLTWTASSYANLNYVEIWRAPALMDAAGMTAGGSYVIQVIGTVNWAAIGATAPVMSALVNGSSYIITALGTINWAGIGSNATAAVGSIFTYNGATVIGSGGSVFNTAFTKNSVAITGTGGAVAFSPALSVAVKIGTSNGHIFVDSVDPGSVFAYWIRYISNSNTAGPYNSSVGTRGATAVGGGNGTAGWSYTAENLYAVQAWISNADILDGNITNAKIGQLIQSSNYNPSAYTGWSIDKSGNINSYGTLTLYDNLGNIALSSGPSPSFDFNYVGGTSKPANNATRNVFKGNWLTATAYVSGDIVIDTAGYGWSCILAHTSSGLIMPPTYPTSANVYWTLYAVKGVDSITAVLSNDTHVLPSASDGTVTDYSNSGTTITIYDGTSVLTYDGVGTAAGSWKVTTSVTNITVGTLTGSGTYLTVGVQSGVSTSIDTASIIYTISGTRINGVSFSMTAQQSFAKSKAAVSPYTVVISSTNGNDFRVGQGKTTTLIAYVFQGGVDITSTLLASQFRWRRVSIIAESYPNDDTTWNADYATGYKQVSVSVDLFFSKATFFCDIMSLT